MRRKIDQTEPKQNGDPVKSTKLDLESTWCQALEFNQFRIGLETQLTLGIFQEKKSWFENVREVYRRSLKATEVLRTQKVIVIEDDKRGYQKVKEGRSWKAIVSNMQKVIEGKVLDSYGIWTRA